MRWSRAIPIAAITTTATLAQAPLTQVWQATGPSVAYGYGIAVAGVGDLDGDGFADLAIGGPYVDLNASTQQSRLYVFRGGGSGPAQAWDHRYWETQNFFQLGRILAGADVNGDGFSDLFSGSQVGIVRGYYGSAAGPSPATSWTFSNPGGVYTVVANAGDVNDDGYDDVVIGLPYCTREQTREGCAYLYLGSQNGLGSTAAWTAEGDLANAQFGSAVAGVGDVDLDGYDDVVVAAPYHASYRGRISEATGTRNSGRPR